MGEWLSALVLVGGVLCYGLAGVRLSQGSTAEGGALRSSAWWWGTALQGAGFGLTFLARQDLPMLFVQAASVAALAVTAVAGQLAGVHRLQRGDWLAVAALMAGLFAVSQGTEPQSHLTPAPATLPVLLGLLALGALGLVRRWSAPVLGLLSGLGFSVGAVGARLVAAGDTEPFWAFWGWGVGTWLALALIPVGLVLGQTHLTRGLATRRNVTTLGAMYTAATITPALVGIALLGEVPRPGAEPWVVVGVALTLVGGWRLARIEAGELAPQT